MHTADDKHTLGDWLAANNLDGRAKCVFVGVGCSFWLALGFGGRWCTWAWQAASNLDGWAR